MNERTLLNLANCERRLPIDCVSSIVRECYRTFDKLMITNSRELLEKVECISLSSTESNDYVKSVLTHIPRFSKLLFLTFRGGKRPDTQDYVRGNVWDLPTDMAKLTKLVYLDLSFNMISKTPRWLFEMRNLQRLQLSFCDLTEVPNEIKNLCCLVELHLKENKLTSLPEEISSLKSLGILNISNNKLSEIPSCVSQLPNLVSLDLSENCIKGDLFSFSESKIEVIKLRHNCIGTVDEDFSNLPALKMLDLRYNNIRNVSQKLASKDFLLLEGNPLGYNSPEGNGNVNSDSYNVSNQILECDAGLIKYRRGRGVCAVLPCGINIILPKKALSEDNSFYCQILPLNEVNIVLDDMDQLLSDVLELSPSMRFDEPVSVSIPYTFERHDQQIREIVIRVFSDDDIEDLSTDVLDGGNKGEMVAKAFTKHFSRFAVIARLFQTSAVIEKEHSRLLFSNVFPQTKLHFPEDCVDDNTKVIMQIIEVDPQIINEVSETASSAASCVLCIKVFPSNYVFKKLVIVKLALPDKLLGKNFDRSKLKLLKCAHGSEEWTDVTSVYNMEISSVDVTFHVESFSKFILVTELICGVVRKIYRRLRTHRVQFIAMQKRSLPSQVLAQCVLEKKIDSRIRQLLESGYMGDDCMTHVQQLVEGDTYKIKVIGDLRLQMYDKKVSSHIKHKISKCRFFSQYPPNKTGFTRFFIESESNNEKKTHTGYVAFYKVDDNGCKPDTTALKPQAPVSHEPQKRSSGQDNSIENPRQTVFAVGHSDSSDEELLDGDDHLGDVPIMLENENFLTHNQSRTFNLDFGNLGTGMFRDENLRLLAYKIGNEWREIGTFLEIPYSQLDRIAADYHGNSLEQIFRMLKFWANLHKNDEDCLEQFTTGISSAGRNDLVEEVKALYEDGKQEFLSSVKRKK